MSTHLKRHTMIAVITIDTTRMTSAKTPNVVTTLGTSRLGGGDMGEGEGEKGGDGRLGGLGGRKGGLPEPASVMLVA